MIKVTYNPGRTRGEGRLSLYMVQKVGRIVSEHLKLQDELVISVAFVDRGTIQTLNRQYRGKDKVTDVLSFEYGEDDAYGEVIICPAQARAQVKESGRSVRDEMIFLLVHGLLHVFGFDHIKPADAKVMFPLQEKIFQNIV